LRLDPLADQTRILVNSVLGHKLTFGNEIVMSAFPPKADMHAYHGAISPSQSISINNSF